MKKLNTQKGFTLVELAIVMTIIGLLIGGILKGQEMVKNAKVTATLAQIQAYNAAIATFQDKYAGLPGDIANAASRIPNCVNATTACVGPAATTGDGSVGTPGWDLSTSQSATAIALVSTNVNNETIFFWSQLANANLISGINYNGSALAANAATAGTHMPMSKLNLPFVVGSTNGAISQSLAPAVACSPTHVCPSGLVVMLTPAPNAVAPTATGTVGVTPAMAAQIDRKIDDGNPLAGAVSAYGFNSATATAGCFNSATRLYNEALSANDCGLVFGLAG